MLPESLQPSSMHCFPEQGYGINTVGHRLELATVSLHLSSLYQIFLSACRGKGLSFNLMSLTKADMRAWNNHWKCEDLPSLFCLSFLHRWNVACIWLEILLPFHTCTWQSHGTLGSMTKRFRLVIHHESFHLWVLPFLEFSSSHS